jgi:glycosyltransferase involved in cell wall biosynthesis
MIAITSVTAIVPICNMAGRLSNLQTWIFKNPGMKIILIHDVTDDATGIELEIMVKDLNSDLITLISGRYGSPGLARNAGIELVRTEWVVFWDSDDIADPIALEKSIKTIDDEIDVGVFSYRVHDIKSYETFSVDAFDNEFNLVAMEIGIWRFLFKTKTLDGLKFNSLRMGEDQIFVLEALSRANRVVKSSHSIYTYHINFEGQLTRNSKAILEIFDALGIVLNTKTSGEFVTRSFKKIVLTKLAVSILKKNPRSLFDMRIFFRVIKAMSIHGIYYILKNRKSYKTRFLNSVVINGGLGNQLFQYAFLLNHSMTGLLDASLGNFRKSSNGNFPEICDINLGGDVKVGEVKPINFLQKKLANFILRLSTSSGFYATLMRAEIINRVCAWILDQRGNQLLIPRNLGYQSSFEEKKTIVSFGYFQSYMWAQSEHVNNCLQELHPKSVNPEVFGLIEQAKKISPMIVHVRGGDYLSESKFGNLSKEYYENSIERALKIFTREIWLFSDDELFAVNLLKSIGISNVKLIKTSHFTSAESLEIMKYGGAYVIANSSFSWWAAFLRKDKSAFVTCPFPWFLDIPEPNALIPPDWHREASNFMPIH